MIFDFSGLLGIHTLSGILGLGKWLIQLLKFVTLDQKIECLFGDIKLSLSPKRVSQIYYF